jgi:transcriptional regulator with XRE-family HTH domain
MTKAGSGSRDGEGADERPSPIDPAQVGDIIKRMRKQHGLSLRDVAQASGLSTSFLSSVERGESDIAVGRLARVAECFDHDVGSLLGYSSRKARPQFVGPKDRVQVSRGPGVSYEAYRLPALGMELFKVAFEPGAGFDNEITHEGLDALLVLQGTLTLRIDGRDYTVQEGGCVVWSAAYAHSLRNEAGVSALAVGLGESVY